METILVSKILYLDKEYQPCGTRIIRRPDATHNTDHTDSDHVMSYGIRAFDDGEFERYPRYWVPYEGDIEDFRDLHIQPDGFLESILVKHFRFISLHEVNHKVRRIKELLAFQSAYHDAEFVVSGSWIKENQTIVSLCDGDEDGIKFSLGNFLYSLQYGIDECRDAIESTHKQIEDRRNDMRFIMETASMFQCNNFSNIVCVGNDCYVDYRKFRKIIFSPAYNKMEETIHNLKKRMAELERQRSYMQLVMSLIMTTTWYGETSK